MIDPRYKVTQTWEQHIRNAGKHLGGVDYAMPIGTPLPILEGVLEWITPATPVRDRPAWYNTGLGNAAAYRRPDGTRTVYGHCHRRAGRQVWSGNTGKSTGPHLHAHDVLADGTTRVPPFSTIAALTGRNAPMTHLFHKLGSNPTLYALAGGSPGTPANWLETQDRNFANQLSEQIGASSAGLTPPSFEAWKAAYLAPVTIAGTTTGSGATAAAIADELAERLKA